MSEGSDLEEQKRLLALVDNAEELKDIHRRARIGVTHRLGVEKLVRSECKFRNWPTDDEFVMVLSLAVSFFMQGALRQRLRRPLSADAPELNGRWPRPAFYASAKGIVDSFDLGELPNKLS